jgi:hypothetical protein
MALAALLAIGGVACEDDDDSDGGATATQSSGETAGDATPTEGAATGDTVDVTMNEEAGSGVTGSATLTGGTDGTAVEVTIDTGLEEGSHASHIHTGTCAAQGPIETPLTDITADDLGAGTATTPYPEVTTPIETLQDGNHIITVFDRIVGAIVSCGDIPTA